MRTESGALPPELDLRNLRQTGAEVIERGLPALPAQLRSHFGSYLACAEKPGLFDVAAFDSDGNPLATLAYLPPGHRSRR